MTASVAEIFVYPVKSLGGVSVNSATVETAGLQHDRRWALVDAKNHVVTAREYPALLQLQCCIGADGVQINHRDTDSIEIPFFVDTPRPDEALTIFKGAVTGYEINSPLNEFFSDYLGVGCRLMGISSKLERPVASRHGGVDGDTVAFADSCPLLLTSDASLVELNQHISQAYQTAESRRAEPLVELISMRHLRPNIVVKGVNPYVEESWSELDIQQLRFTVSQLCKRCILSTINPDNSQLHPHQEPLRSLSRTRPRFRGGVAFGIHLTPRQGSLRGSGLITVGDVVTPIIG